MTKLAVQLLLCAAISRAAGTDPAALAAKGLQELRERHEKAGEKDLQRALEKWESQPGGPPAEFAPHAEVMAAILQGKTKFGEEQKLLDEAERFYSSAGPSEDPGVALFLELKASVLEQNGDLGAAKEAKARASAIRDRLVTDRFKGQAQLAGPVLPHIGDADRKPRLIYKVDPDYSEIARLARVEGTSVLSVFVGSDGMPANVHVKGSLGFGLDEKAAEAVMKWRFQPAIKDGKPIAVEAAIEFHFKLLR